jgi:hypothetical protein
MAWSQKRRSAQELKKTGAHATCAPGTDRVALIQELRAERDAHAMASARVAQEAAAPAWFEARRVEGRSDS